MVLRGAHCIEAVEVKASGMWNLPVLWPRTYYLRDNVFHGEFAGHGEFAA